MADEIKTPMPPKRFPAKEQAAWKKKYIDAYRQAQSDYPDNEPQQQQFALREANRMLKVPEPASYAEAMALPDYHVMRREVAAGKLKLVTADGRKYSFDAPKGKDQKLDPGQA